MKQLPIEVKVIQSLSIKLSQEERKNYPDQQDTDRDVRRKSDTWPKWNESWKNRGNQRKILGENCGRPTLH